MKPRTGGGLENVHSALRVGGCCVKPAAAIHELPNLPGTPKRASSHRRGGGWVYMSLSDPCLSGFITTALAEEVEWG